MSSSDVIPDQPWQARSQWIDGQMTTERDSLTAGGGGVLAGILLVVPGLIGLLIGLSLSATKVTVGGSLALAVGGGLLGWRGYKLLRRRDFGATTFEMDTLPGAIDGPLCGTLYTGIPVEEAPEDGFRVTVACRRRRTHEGNVKYNLLWQDEKQFEGVPSEDGTLNVPVGFELPQEPPPSTPEKTSERVMWTVKVSADVSGGSYTAVFEIPVFPVKSAPAVDLEKYTQHELDYAFDEPVTDGLTLRRPHQDRLELEKGYGRRFRTAAFLTLATLVFGGGGLAAIAFGLTILWGKQGQLQVLGLGGFALLCITPFAWRAYKLWTYHNRVRIDERGIQVREGPLGAETETRIPCSALDQTRLEASSDGNFVVDYNLHLTYTTPDALGSQEQEHEVVAARSLPDHLEAEWIAEQIQQVAAQQARDE